MSYQVPSQVKALIIKENQFLKLYKIKPSEYVRLRNAIMTFYFNGLLGEDFSLKLNLYSDSKGNKLLMSSNTITNAMITRSANYYCELRFDFPLSSNILGIKNDHLLELEISGSASFDDDNFIGQILDYDNTLGNVEGDYILYTADNVGARMSLFFDKA